MALLRWINMSNIQENNMCNNYGKHNYHTSVLYYMNNLMEMNAKIYLINIKFHIILIVIIHLINNHIESTDKQNIYNFCSSSYLQYLSTQNLSTYTMPWEINPNTKSIFSSLLKNPLFPQSILQNSFTTMYAFSVLDIFFV